MEKLEKAIKKTERSEKSVKRYQHFVLRVALLILVIGPLIELPTLALAANLRLGRRRRLGLQ